MTRHGVCVQFKHINAKTKFLHDMKHQGIDIFTDEIGYDCYIKSYTNDGPVGYFLSDEQRVGLAFLSEKQKFSFKEYLNLESDAFMDMGPGYEAQMHFNHDAFPCVEGAEIIVNIEYS